MAAKDFCPPDCAAAATVAMITNANTAKRVGLVAIAIVVFILILL
jgi:hypothetical protein